MPNLAPQNVSCGGNVTLPFTASASNFFVMSATSSKSRQTWTLPSVATGMPGWVSLIMMTPSPMRRRACMTRFWCSAATFIPGTSPKRMSPSVFPPSALS